MAHKEDLRVPALTPLWVVTQDKGALASLTLYVLNMLASLLLPREGNAPGQPFLFHRLL